VYRLSRGDSDGAAAADGGDHWPGRPWLSFFFFNVLFLVSKPQGNVEQSRSKGCVGSVPRDLDHFPTQNERVASSNAEKNDWAE
jgi:hypothetical protein